MYYMCMYIQYTSLHYVYYTCVPPLIQDGIITILNTRVSILAAVNPLYKLLL